MTYYYVCHFHSEALLCAESIRRYSTSEVGLHTYIRGLCSAYRRHYRLQCITGQHWTAVTTLHYWCYGIARLGHVYTSSFRGGAARSTV